jgi:uncharacterized membrane protein YoaK (UPF0700 family)
MTFDRNFWFAIIFFVLFVITLTTWIRRGFESYLVTGTFLFLILGVAFMRRAWINRK